MFDSLLGFGLSVMVVWMDDVVNVVDGVDVSVVRLVKVGSRVEVEAGLFVVVV